MQIDRNAQTKADIGTALSKIPAAAQDLFKQLHQVVTTWVDSSKARITCQAHAKGVTYLKVNRAFVWVNFNKGGLSVLLPNLKADDFEGAVPSTDITNGQEGIRLSVKSAAAFPIALKAFQEAYPLF